MRYLILISLFLFGCMTGPDKPIPDGRVLGYALGIVDSTDRGVILLVGIPDSASDVNGTSFVFYGQKTCFRIIIPDSVHRANLAFPVYNQGPGRRVSGFGPNGNFYEALKNDVPLLMESGHCMTWDQSKFSDKIPCVPFTRE